MSFVINDSGAMIHIDSKKHKTLDIPKVATPFEDAKELRVLGVSLHQDGCHLATIETPEGPVAYILPKDIPNSLDKWARNMAALTNEGIECFPCNVTFGKYRDNYFARKC